MSSFRRRLMMTQGGDGSALDPYTYIYRTTSPNEDVCIMYMSQYAKRIWLEDGTELEIPGMAVNYIFEEAGDHKVYIELYKETSLIFCFSGCKNLISIPEDLFANNTAVTSFYHCFENCSGLTSIPANLFANNTAVTDFSYCFQNCTSLTSPCPIDNDGTPIYNRSSGKEGYVTPKYYSSCFSGCINMEDYASIPSSWGGGGA